MTKLNQKLNRKKKDGRLARKAATAGLSIGETSYERRQSRTEASALLKSARVHNRTLVNDLLREGRISAETAKAIKNRFCISHQTLRHTAFQALQLMGEPLEGESPYQKLTEEEVLAEDAARKGEAEAARLETGEDEEGKGKGKGVEDPSEYDEESDWEGLVPVSGDEKGEEEEDV
ncbi:hypothetical protein MMC26_006810 [Xylographa opegraphella]|nr:hypothetical protein [Xylographa opegraphella]